MNLYTELTAIDIGTYSIKLADVAHKSSKHGYEIDYLESVVLPRGLVGGDFTRPFISDTKKFKDILYKLVQSAKKPEQGYVIGLPDRWVKLHLTEITLTSSELENHDFLKWRLQKNLPVPDDISVIIDYQILNHEEPADSKYTVLAAVVNSEIIETLSALTAELRMEVMTFDTSSLGIFNLYQEVFPQNVTNNAVINLHVGNETTVIKVYLDKKIIYERVIEVAGESFTEIISEIDETDFEAALKTKHEEAFFPVSEEELLQMISKRQRIEKIFGNWLRELNVTFRFYQDKFNSTSIPVVFMTGGSSQFKGLAEFITEYFETACSIFNPLDDLPLTHKPKKEHLMQGSTYAACLGLLAK